MSHARKRHIRKANDYARVIPYVADMPEQGLHGVTVTMLTYNIGNCGASTVDNPHNRGTQPDTCNACYAVS